MNGDLKLTLAATQEAKGGEQFGTIRGSGLFPQVSYPFLDNLEIAASAFVFDGKEGSLFGSFKDQDHVFFKAKYNL